MEEQKSVSKGVVASISVFAVVAIVSGGGLAWLMTQQNKQPVATNRPAELSPTIVPNPGTSANPPGIKPLPAVTTPPTANNPTTQNPVPSVGSIPKPNPPKIAINNERTVRIWRVDDDGKKTFLVPQERQVPPETSKDPDVLVKRPLNSLLASAGKPDGKLTSTIPVGTKLLSANVEPDGIHINLSKEFTNGFGATSMIGRLGQVIYTVTSDNPDAPVWINVDGKPLEVLGDVGVEIRQPMTRQMYDQDFPINPGKVNNP